MKEFFRRLFLVIILAPIGIPAVMITLIIAVVFETKRTDNLIMKMADFYANLIEE